MGRARFRPKWNPNMFPLEQHLIPLEEAWFRLVHLCHFSVLMTSPTAVMLAEVLQVLRGAGKVGSALMLTQGEQLRLMACNSSLAAGVKAAQDAAEGAMAALFGSASQVRFVHIK